MYKFYTILFFLFTSLIYGQYNIEHSVYFETSLFSLSKTEEIRLQKFIDSLPKKDVTKIQIYGFCDDRGAEEYNLGLSQNRADEIKKLFKQEAVLHNKILNVDGRGEILLNIINENNPEIIRALNRRVDIVVSYPEIQSSEPKEEKLLLGNVLFITGYSYLTYSSKAVLENIAKKIKENNFNFIIQGHVCCTKGVVDAVDKKTNKRNLSVARAKFVYDYFIDYGIRSERMSYEGLGHRFPLGGSDDKNRRVEILILND